MTQRFWFPLKYGSTFLMAGLLIWSTGSVSAAQIEDSNKLLTRYHQALQGLTSPPQKRYSQQIQTSNWQEGIATADFRFQEDGSWEAQIQDGDKLRTLNSSQVELVDQGDRLRMYSLYVQQPEKLAPHVTVDLDATPEAYTPVVMETRELGGKPVDYLQLKPNNRGRLRELWLDPETALPRRAKLYLSGIWGVANMTLDFQPVETYWLPLQTRMEIDMNFWVPAGLSQRTFKGLVDIGSQYTDYQLGAQAAQPLPSAPSPTQTAQSPTENNGKSDKVEGSPPKNSSLGKPLEVGVSTQKSSSLLADRIADFNLSKPDLSDPKTHINTFYTLRMGKTSLLMYLFRFDSKQPLVPIEPANTRGDSFKIFGN
jgi:hypothetical protein